MRITVLALLAAASAAAQEAPKKKVLCTLPVLESLVREVGGDAFDVGSLSRPDQDPHFVSPTPSLMKKLREADLFIQIGLQLELWADPVADGSGNPRVQKGGPGRITASAGIPREEVPKVLSRAEGDVHPEGNPHLWLDPLRAKAIAENIARALEAAAPERKAEIEARLKRFKDRIDEAVFGADLVREAGGAALTRRALDGTLAAWLEERKLSDRLGGWLRKAAPLRGRKVVEFHRTWVYFARLFGLEIVGSVEPKPGIAPGPQHLARLRELLRQGGAGLILVENYQDLSNPRALEEQTGVRMVVLPTQPGGEPGTEDYFKMIDFILGRLLEGAKDR
ncbi:MAG TPA: metal ABC transporter substrate-binding protein [Planctomycetota bacterium]|jgi:ABC-type Zn uptake system ZnuABC Zn-binding protein ZnuA|nr:metal ABC transporter substrate-binding protein [Planctomycetota bacterium]